MYDRSNNIENKCQNKKKRQSGNRGYWNLNLRQNTFSYVNSLNKHAWLTLTNSGSILTCAHTTSHLILPSAKEI